MLDQPLWIENLKGEVSWNNGYSPFKLVLFDLLHILSYFLTREEAEILDYWEHYYII